MLCKECGSELPENAKFCGKCGAAVEQSAAPADSISTAPKGKRHVPKGKILAVSTTVLALIAVFIVGGYFLITGNRDADENSDEYSRRSGNNENRDRKQITMLYTEPMCLLAKMVT